MGPLAVAHSETTRKNPSIANVAGASLVESTLEVDARAVDGSAAAPAVPKLFFPQADALTSTLPSLPSYGVAFVARPVGGAIFGRFGDRIGRESLLIIPLLGLATFAVGLSIPLASAIGLTVAAVLAARGASRFGLRQERAAAAPAVAPARAAA